jgi:hypothetical protein
VLHAKRPKNALERCFENDGKTFATWRAKRLLAKQGKEEEDEEEKEENT